jgi:6-phosphogluconolactonase (cycloisomerase 2 family)
MRSLIRLITAAATLACVFGASAAAASADPGFAPGFGGGLDRTVFVQTDNLAGNQIVAYDRSANGTLTQAGIYNTGGLGGQLTGSVVDHTASQGSLVYDRYQGVLYAVNAGSNTVSAFAVRGDRLFLTQVISSGGSFPASIAVERNLVYVLNAEGAGSVQGYYSLFGHLVALPGSNRSLGLTPVTGPNQFVSTPGQVAFAPGGHELIVTTKANGSDVDVFRVGALGELSATPVVNSEPGAVPFAITFDPTGDLVIAEAGTDALASFTLNPSGTVTPLTTAGTGAAATCWVAPADGLLYASNAGSATVSAFQPGSGGSLALLGATQTDGGTVDASASSDGRDLYVQTGLAGIVDEFSIGSGGALTEVGSVAVPGAVGGEGIVAS